jgi:hypothetical protein
VDLLAEPVLTKAQQRQVLDEVEPALRSPDRDARVGAMQILESMQGREDLYADVAARVAMLLASRGPSEREPLPPPPPPPPPEPRPVKKSSGVRTLLIVLVVLGVLGLGGCLAVVGALSSVAPQPTPTSYAPAPLPATTSYVPAPQPATPSPVTPIGPNGEQLGDICTADTPYGPQQGLVYGVVGNPTAYCLGYDGILYGFY